MSEMIKARVTAREEQGLDVVVLSVSPIMSDTLPVFEAGAHIDLHLGEGLVRQYSLCSSARDRSAYRLGILKDPASRGGSLAAHALQVGQEIVIGAPRNMFPLDLSAGHSILVGGGIGITPMLAMADTLYHSGKSFELHYCSRSGKHSAFLQELTHARWADQVTLHFDDEGEDQRLNIDQIVRSAADNSHVYVCGPEGFMNWVIGSAKAAGLSDSAIHKEFFNKNVETSGESFDVSVPDLNLTVKVGENQTIVQALADAGVRVKVSCEQGVCGTCLANVLEGLPDHRDSYLTDDEKADNDQIILCCSRAKSKSLIIEVFEVI